MGGFVNKHPGGFSFCRKSCFKKKLNITENQPFTDKSLKHLFLGKEKQHFSFIILIKYHF